MERDDFKIELENHNIIISAEKEEKKDVLDGYCRREYSFNSFSRSFTLPENVKESDIDAKYENGVLLIHIPKSKEATEKPVHRISIN